MKLLRVITLLLLTVAAPQGWASEYMEQLKELDKNRLVDLSETKQALEELGKLKTEFTQEELDRYNLVLGHSVAVGGDYAQAHEILSALIKSSNSATIKARSLAIQSSLYNIQGENIKAFVSLDKSMNLLEAIDSEVYKLDVLANAVSVYKDADLIEFAMEIGRRFMLTAKEAKLEDGLCHAQYELASIELLAKKLMLAEQRFNVAKTHCVKAQNAMVRLAIENQLASILIAKQKYKEAQALLEKNYQEVQEYGWNILIGLTDLNLGKVFYELKDYETAKKYAKSGYEISKKYGDKKRVEIGAGLLGEIFTALKKDDEAVRYFKEYIRLDELNKTRIRQRKLAFDIARRGTID